MASVQAVADYILGKIDPEAGDSITNLKLQKLVYYVQAWHLALKDTPAFHEPVEAWAHGPVVRPLYARFADYGWQAVDPTHRETDPDHALSKGTRELIDEVWEVYGDYSGSELEALTHSEDPWKEVYGDRPVGARCNDAIPHDLMRSYYRSLINGQEQRAHS